jgi:hypothetical protein
MIPPMITMAMIPKNSGAPVSSENAPPELVV